MDLTLSTNQIKERCWFRLSSLDAFKSLPWSSFSYSHILVKARLPLSPKLGVPLVLICNVKNEETLPSQNMSFWEIVMKTTLSFAEENAPNQWSGRFLGMIGWDPSVCKSNQLHVDILRFSFILSLAAYSTYYSKMIGDSPDISNFNRLFLKLNWCIRNLTNCRFSPIIAPNMSSWNTRSPILIPTVWYGNIVPKSTSEYFLVLRWWFYNRVFESKLNGPPSCRG